MTNNVILRVATKIMMPYILLFGLYVHFHGDLSPGGGFQAGVMLAAGFILYALVYGLKNTQEVLPPSFANMCMALGVLIYAGTGVAGLLMGGNFLDYNVLAHDTIHGQHRGIYWVEIGVVTTVFGTMVSIFYAVADRKGED